MVGMYGEEVYSIQYYTVTSGRFLCSSDIPVSYTNKTEYEINYILFEVASLSNLYR